MARADSFAVPILHYRSAVTALRPYYRSRLACLAQSNLHDCLNTIARHICPWFPASQCPRPKTGKLLSSFGACTRRHFNIDRLLEKSPCIIMHWLWVEDLSAYAWQGCPSVLSSLDGHIFSTHINLRMANLYCPHSRKYIYGPMYRIKLQQFPASFEAVAWDILILLGTLGIEAWRSLKIWPLNAHAFASSSCDVIYMMFFI